MNKILIVCLFSVFISCKSDNFYNYYSTEDLWRLPLVEPYELRNIAGVKKGFSPNDNWHIKFLYLKSDIKTLSFSALNVTNINVEKNIIYGFGSKYPSFHFIINLNTGKETIFPSERNWSVALAALGISSRNTLDVFDVFAEFKETRRLPWRYE